MQKNMSKTIGMITLYLALKYAVTRKGAKMEKKNYYDNDPYIHGHAGSDDESPSPSKLTAEQKADRKTRLKAVLKELLKK